MSVSPKKLTPEQLRAEAEAAAGLPSLMLSAERLAAALTAGAHGQRRAGPGEDFWQYRPATSGDTARSIDWRRSARSDGQFVRDREAEVSQSASIWVSAAAGMDYAGGADRPPKRARADLLALAFGRLSSGVGSEQFDTFATLNGSVQEAIARRARQLGHERAAAQAETLAQRSSAPGSA